MTSYYETAVGFLASRADFFRFETVDRPDGGWDVVLRVDGTYSNDAADFMGVGWSRDEMVAYMTRWLQRVLANEGIEPGHLLHLDEQAAP